MAFYRSRYVTTTHTHVPLPLIQWHKATAYERTASFTEALMEVRLESRTWKRERDWIWGYRSRGHPVESRVPCYRCVIAGAALL